jgi:hypothetical protein
MKTMNVMTIIKEGLRPKVVADSPCSMAIAILSQNLNISY